MAAILNLETLNLYSLTQKPLRKCYYTTILDEGKDFGAIFPFSAILTSILPVILNFLKTLKGASLAPLVCKKQGLGYKNCTKPMWDPRCKLTPFVPPDYYIIFSDHKTSDIILNGTTHKNETL